VVVTQAEFIAKINPHLMQEGCASEEALRLVTKAIRAFPGSAELWFLHGRVLMKAAEAEVWETAGRSFEMAIQINPAMTEAHEALKCYQQAMSVREGQASSPAINPPPVRRPHL
jgi:cytochrome c-type biogenesis protein CcmH/NrfG